MKEKISLMLVALLAILMLCACGKDPKTVDYNGKSYDDLGQEAVMNAYLTHNAAIYASEGKISSISDYLSTYGFSYIIDDGYYNTWLELEEKYGDCTELGLYDGDDAQNVFEQEKARILENFKISKAGNTLTTNITLKFGEKDVIYELVYDYYDMSITSVTINPVQTMGEKMKSAGQNTIISLAIVFGVLILISLIIKGFVIFPKIEEKKKNKAKAIEEAKASAASVYDAPVASEPAASENLMDDLELVAVITAAIAASEGTSTSGFVVRSINRR